MSRHMDRLEGHVKQDHCSFSSATTPMLAEGKRERFISPHSPDGQTAAKTKKHKWRVNKNVLHRTIQRNAGAANSPTRQCCP